MLARHIGAPLAAACLAAAVQAANAPAGRAQEGPLVSGLHHVHLNVVDPDRSIAFYTSAFESTQKTAVAGWPAVRSEAVHLLFEQVPAAAPADLDAPLWHFGWNSPDLFGNGGLRAAMIEGPDRLAIELVETGAEPG